MRVPLVRFGDDKTPLAWWELLFTPLAVPAFFIVFGALGVVSLAFIPYFALYPEHHLREDDWGTEREQEVMRRYRRYAARVSFWVRLRRALVIACRLHRRRVPRRVLREARRAGDAPSGRAE